MSRILKSSALIAMTLGVTSCLDYRQKVYRLHLPTGTGEITFVDLRGGESPIHSFATLVGEYLPGGELEKDLPRFVLDDMWREVTLYPAGNPEKLVYTNPTFGGYGGFTDTFVDRIHTFLQQVTDGVSPDEIDGSGVDGLAAQKVLAAAIESLETGTVVQV